MLSQKQLLHKCYSKKKYLNIDEANLKGIEQMKKYGSNQLYMYLCSNCNKWHLTHKETKYRVV